jgi:hypothetical protein
VGVGLYGIGGFAGGWPRRVCTSDVALYAEVGGERRRVGTLHAGASFGIDDDVPGGLTSVKLFEVPLEPADGATFLVSTKDLDACL